MITAIATRSAPYLSLALALACFASASAFFALAPAWAEPFRDAQSGLAVEPPPGYVASTGRPQTGASVRIDVKRPDDKDTGCGVGFSHAPQNALLDQAEINAIASSPEWLTMARSAVAFLYDVLTAEPFDHAEVRGAVMIADFKARANLPPRSQEIRTALYLLETPKGRVNVVCVGERGTFDARRPEFDAVVRGVTLPR
jgi:hypothetical protein